MSDELCGVCGASWECEHRPGPVVTSYVDDPYGPPVGKLASTRETDVLAFLKRAVAALEHGSVKADAVYLVLSEGDIHRPAWQGFDDWFQLRRAATAHEEERLRRSGFGKSPEENAARRQEARVKRAADQWAEMFAEPYRCRCRERFKTIRGWSQHVNLQVTRYRRLREQASGGEEPHQLVHGPEEYPRLRP